MKVPFSAKKIYNFTVPLNFESQLVFQSCLQESCSPLQIPISYTCTYNTTIADQIEIPGFNNKYKFNFGALLPKSCGLLDKAPDFGSEGCRFESLSNVWDRFFFLF